MSELDWSNQRLGDGEVQRRVDAVPDEDVVGTLWLDNNNLSLQPKLTNRPAFKELSVLNLSRNKLTHITPTDIPPGVEYLHLDYNQLTEVNDFRPLYKLQELFLSYNNITGHINGSVFPSTITHLGLSGNHITGISNMDHMVHLQELYLYNNNIEQVGELHQLPQLRILWLHNNNISLLHTLPPGIVNILLRGNPLQELGEGCFKSQQMYEALITSTYYGLIPSQIQALKSPPPDVVNAGYEHILAYYKDTEKDTTKLWDDDEKQALVSTSAARLMMCGKTSFGKSSLARSLVYNIPYTARIDDRTRVVNYHSWVISDDTTVPLFDLGGHMCYQQLAHLFHANAPNNLAVLVHQLSSDDYQTTCQWITDVISRSPLSHLLIALTKSDGLAEGEIFKQKKSFKNNIIPYLNKELESLKFRGSDNNTHLSDMMKQYTQIKTKINDESIIHIVNCKSVEGYRPIRQSIIDIVNSPECRISIPVEAHQLYIHLGKLGVENIKNKVSDEPTYTDLIEEIIPQISDDNRSDTEMREESYAHEEDGDVLSSGPHPKMSRMRRAMDCIFPCIKYPRRSSLHSISTLSTVLKIPVSKLKDMAPTVSQSQVSNSEQSNSLQYISFDKAKEMFTEKVAKIQVQSDADVISKLKTCLDLLHKHGLLIWYNGNKELEEFIFNDIHSFVNVLKTLFRHDSQEIFSFSSLSTDVQGKLQRLRKINKTKLTRFTQQLQQQGLMSVELLNAFAMERGFHENLETLTVVLEHLNIAYLIPSQNTDIYGQYMLFPWYTQDNPPEDIQKFISNVTTPSAVHHTLHMNVNGYLPLPFFQNLCVLFQKELIQHRDDQTRSMWKNGLYSRIDKTKLLFKHKAKHMEKDAIEMFVQSPLDTGPISQSWDLIRHCLTAVDDLSNNWWPGIVTDTYLHCPYCDRMGIDEEDCRWDVEDHVGHVCQKGETSQCRRIKDHDFPCGLIYPLPEDETSANQCVEDMRKYMDSIKEVYPMTSTPRGRAVIINNHIFTKLQDRPGTEKDRDDLEKLFKELNFTTVVHNDKTGSEIKQILFDESAHPDHKDADAFILCVLSHGRKDHIIGVDGKHVEIDYIRKRFDGNTCPALAGKPKIFIIQACQKVLAMSTDVAADASHPSSTVAVPGKVHEKADMLTAYSTVSDYESYRDITHGSWFINAIVEIFSKYKGQEHIEEMLKRVTKTVSEQTTPGEQKQIPEIRNTLTKNMYFYPHYAQK